jgi:hypothetical protein
MVTARPVGRPQQTMTRIHTLKKLGFEEEKGAAKNG